MSEFKVTISNGNSKIGNIPNMSMTPIKSCAHGVPCGFIPEGKKTGKCYALKSYLMYPNVRKAWDGNLSYWRNDPVQFEKDLIDYMNKKRSLPYWRWFVSGDIPGGEFLMLMVRVARMFPNTKFLSFTKHYSLINNYVYAFCDDDRSNMPDNLSIVFSAWPNFPMKNRYEFPVAWYLDDNDWDNRIPFAAPRHNCPGSCTDCKFCWSPSKPIIFAAH